MGRKKVTITLNDANYELENLKKKYPIQVDKKILTLSYNDNDQKFLISNLLGELAQSSIKFNDISIEQSNLEEIFIKLVKK